MIESKRTLLPQPYSSIEPTISLLAIERSTPFTALAKPSSVGKSTYNLEIVRKFNLKSPFFRVTLLKSYGIDKLSIDNVFCNA